MKLYEAHINVSKNYIFDNKMTQFYTTLDNHTNGMKKHSTHLRTHSITLTEEYLKWNRQYKMSNDIQIIAILAFATEQKPQNVTVKLAPVIYIFVSKDQQ